MRLLPAAPDAEKALLGSYLRHPDRVGLICAERGIYPSNFHLHGHRLIYACLSEMWNTGKPVDLVTVTDELHKRKELEVIGGASALSEMLMFAHSADSVDYYADILLEKWTLREIIGSCEDGSNRAYTAAEGPSALLEAMSARLMDIAGASIRQDAPTFKEALMEKVERMQANEADADVIRTGINRLDHYSPLRLGDMPLLAGERKAGKSILSLSIATNVVRAGGAVLYFSLEDRTPKVIDRIFAGATRIPAIRHHVKALNQVEQDNMLVAVHKLYELRLQIRDDVFELSKLVAVARHQKTKWPDLSLIVVDYAQLVRANRQKGDNREQEVALVSRTLRLLAMEMNVAIILLSQLNAQGESRESRALEQDATAAWFITKTGKEEEENNRRLISIPWQRNGDSGIGFPVTFLGHLARVEDLANTTES